MAEPIDCSKNESPTTSSRGTDFLDDFVSEEEYAARRGVSLRTCQRDRQMRNAPPHVKFGKKVFYRVEAIRHWLAQREAHADRKPVAPRTRRARS